MVSSFFFVRFYSVALSNDRICATDFAMKVSEYGNDLNIIDMEKVVVVHSHSALSLRRKVALSQDVEVENAVKFVFSPLNSDTINQSRFCCVSVVYGSTLASKRG